MLFPLFITFFINKNTYICLILIMFPNVWYFNEEFFLQQYIFIKVKQLN